MIGVHASAFGRDDGADHPGDAAAAVAPLETAHALLVLDGVSADLITHGAFLATLAILLRFRRLHTMITSRRPVAQPLQGGAEKVIELAPLSEVNTARLLWRLSPRSLRLHELPGASNASDFVAMLARHPLVTLLGGNPGLIKATAPRLQSLSLDELGQSLAAELTAARAAAEVASAAAAEE